MAGEIDGKTNTEIVGHMDGRMDELTDGWMDEWTDGWTDRLTDRRADSNQIKLSLKKLIFTEHNFCGQLSRLLKSNSKCKCSILELPTTLSNVSVFFFLPTEPNNFAAMEKNLVSTL
jgi:hypothetical protein